MKILEIGNYIAPAYAGMILAEQGHTVEKWHINTDPILSLNHGDDLWNWINHGKTLVIRHASEIIHADLSEYGGVIDNFLPSFWEGQGVQIPDLANRYKLRWVSLRSEDGKRSFDLIAQCKSWMEYSGWVPFYIGDTTAGLWMAFKLLSGQDFGHFVLGQASCMQKLVEGELCVTPERLHGSIVWDKDQYRFNSATNRAEIIFKGEILTETVKDTAWKINNLWHNQGRMTI